MSTPNFQSLVKFAMLSFAFSPEAPSSAAEMSNPASSLNNAAFLSERLASPLNTKNEVKSIGLPGWKLGDVAIIDLSGGASAKILFEQERIGTNPLDVVIRDGQEVKIKQFGLERVFVSFVPNSGTEITGWLQNSTILNSANKNSPISRDEELSTRIKSGGPLTQWRIGETAIVSTDSFAKSKGEVFPLEGKECFALKRKFSVGTELEIIKIRQSRSEVRFRIAGQSLKGWVDNCVFESANHKASLVEGRP